MKTVIGLFDQFEDAQMGVRDLRDAGFRSEDVSLISRDASGEFSRYFDHNMEDVATTDVGDGTAAGAGIGAVLGGLGGLLVGLGALAIPGIGPVLAAGPLVSALAGAGIGAVAGGLVGALIDLGVPEEHAQFYAEGIRRGGTLVVVRADDLRADQVMTILNRHNPVDVSRQAETWRQNNWKYDANAKPLSSDEMEFNRVRGRDVIPVTGAAIDNTVLDDTTNRHDFVEHSAVEPNPDRLDRSIDNQDRDLANLAADKLDSTIPVTGNLDRSNLTMGRASSAVDQNAAMGSPESIDMQRMDQTCRPHFATTYAVSGRNYDYYRPAYHFGYELAQDRRFYGFDWNRLEAEARRDWESRGMQGTWDDIKEAVRHAWDEMRD